MAQRRFLDPVVSAGPSLTGTGNGTVSVDRLTHFTTPQDYTLTCIAKAPSTIFSVVGSVDGPVGLATVGTQFYDEALKIFLTLSQGSTAFEVGDEFTLTVENGKDLNQDNIDDYDEEPQKNFGAGTKGSMSGDHSIRFQSAAKAARLFLQDIRYTALTAGSVGNLVQVQYLDPVPATTASVVVQDLTFAAVSSGAGGNAISVKYDPYDLPVNATAIIQDLTYRAVTPGPGGNTITVEYVDGATLAVGVVGNAITVTFPVGTAASEIATTFAATPAAVALAGCNITGTGANAQTAPVAATNLAGGADAVGDAGNEVVTVVGNAISVKMEPGVSTASQILTKLLASSAAMALVGVTLTGTGTNTQTDFTPAVNLAGGVDAYGYVGTELVTVTGNLIQVFLESGKSTATQVMTALNASAPALALVTPLLVGPGAHTQFGPVAATNLSGGKNKQFTLNHDELTDAANFAEGNADLLAKNVSAQGDLDVTGHAALKGMVSLEDAGAAANKSGNPVGNLQRYLNNLIDDRSVVVKTADGSVLAWAHPLLTFTADIEIKIPGAGVTTTIAASNSPISIADGEHLYAIVDRESDTTVTPVVAATLPQGINVVRVASRFGTDLIAFDGSLIRTGKSARLGEGGLPSVSSDAAPQLGGNLDQNGYAQTGKMHRAAVASPSSWVEEEYIHSVTLTAASTNAVCTELTFAFATFRAIEVSYLIIEATTGRTRKGTLIVTTDGVSDVGYTDNGAHSSDVDVTWDAVISGTDVQVRYTTTNANAKTLRADVKRFKTA